MKAPRLVICDGNGGLLRAVGETWAETALQRCVQHRLRNILAKVPKAHHEAVKGGLRAIFYADDEAEARHMAAAFTEQWQSSLPSATACLLSQLDACLTFYRFPREHWPRLRTSNILERCFVEVRRRTNVVGRFPTEESALTLVWAVLVEDPRRWRGMALDQRVLEQIEAAVIELPRSMWAVSNMVQERLAA